MYLIPINFSRINIALAKSAKDVGKMGQAIAKDALQSTMSKICILGEGFANKAQVKLAEKYLLNNDKFMQTASDLVQKTGAKITIVPGSKASSSIGMQILDGKIPFDLFARDKNGATILGFINAKECASATKDAISEFIGKVNKYISGK